MMTLQIVYPEKKLSTFSLGLDTAENGIKFVESAFSRLKLTTGLNYKNLIMTLLKPKKFKIKNIFQDNKTIRVIEKGNNFNFSFDRNYIINNHNSSNFSGFHAHKKFTN